MGSSKKKRGRAGPIEKEAVAPVPSENTAQKKLKVTNNKAPKLSHETTEVVVENARLKESGSTNVLVANATEMKKNKKKKKKKRTGIPALASDTAAEGEKVVKDTKGSEIDDLFASLKAKKQEKNSEDLQQKLIEEEEHRRAKKEKARLQQQIKKLEAQNTNSTAVGLNPDPRPVRYDEDGLPIYSEASLQIGKGGNTKDCPFDCWCCF